FTGDTLEEVQGRAARGGLTATLASLEQGTPDADLLALARACLVPRPGQRPADAGARARAAPASRGSGPERLRPAQVARAAAQARAQGERKARRLTAALAGAVLGIVLLLVGGWRWREGQERARRDRQAAVARAVEEDLREVARLRASPGNWGQALAAAQRAERRPARAA